MDAEKIKEITMIAKDAVADLDPDLKQTAFQTILNKLLDENSATPKKRTTRASKPRKTSSGTTRKVDSKSTEMDGMTKKLLENINRTEHPKLFDLQISLDRALYILKIARDELKIDGLLASQISQVLRDNFRLKVTHNAVSMALMKAVKYVDRKKIVISGGIGYTYHLMHGGEVYLDGVMKSMTKNEEKE